MIYLFICLYLVQYLPSVSFSFLSTGLLFPKVGLFLDILLFFDVVVNGIVSLISPYNSYFSISVEKGFPGGSDGKESTCNAGNLSLIPGLGRSLGSLHTEWTVLLPGSFITTFYATISGNEDLAQRKYSTPPTM